MFDGIHHGIDLVDIKQRQGICIPSLNNLGDQGQLHIPVEAAASRQEEHKHHAKLCVDCFFPRNLMPESHEHDHQRNIPEQTDRG